MRELHRLPGIVLGGGEECTASFLLKEVLPDSTGRQKFKVWAKLMGELSDPIEMEVDFGDGRGPVQQRPQEFSLRSGIFQLTWSTRLLRLAGGYRLLALAPLIVAAATMALLKVLSAKRRRRAHAA